jgi:dTDP-4-amino-4,6-dideoxygalactose transaminase
MPELAGADPVPFTLPRLPALVDVEKILGQIWERGIVTNDGPVQREFEHALGSALDWGNVSVVANGTTALRLMCQAAGLSGEVIVAGFTHAATMQAVLSCGLTPVVADIRRDDLTMDVASAEAKIGTRTSAVLATHVFGKPADVDALSALADAHGLALLFDGAAAVGVRYQGRSLAEYGLASAFSFHATKLLCSVEGGAVSSGDAALVRRVNELRNFGMSAARNADPQGGNGKSNEILCAIGLLALDLLDDEVAGRARALERYRAELAGNESIEFVGVRAQTEWNSSYCSVRVRHPGGRPLAGTIDAALHQHGVQSRRYFAGPYCLPADPGEAPEADVAREEVLCLPLWGEMPASVIARVCELVRTTLLEQAA